MAVLCRMRTIHYSARSAPLSVPPVYFLHSTRRSVTWLNSRSSPAAYDWLISAICRAVNTRPTSQVSCTECAGQGNDLELIPNWNQTPRRVITGNEFLSIYNRCAVMAAWSCKTLKKIIFAFFGKTTHNGKRFKILFRKDSSPHRSTCYVHI